MINKNSSSNIIMFKKINKSEICISNIINERLRSARREKEKDNIIDEIKVYLSEIEKIHIKKLKIMYVKELFNFLVKNKSFVYSIPTFRNTLFKKIDEIKSTEDSMKNFCAYIKLKI